MKCFETWGSGTEVQLVGSGAGNAAASLGTRVNILNFKKLSALNRF
jgi:hypothetical protein